MPLQHGYDRAPALWKLLRSSLQLTKLPKSTLYWDPIPISSIREGFEAIGYAQNKNNRYEIYMEITNKKCVMCDDVDG